MLKSRVVDSGGVNVPVDRKYYRNCRWHHFGLKIQPKKIGRRDSGKINSAGRRDSENNFGRPAGFGKIFSVGRRDSENNFQAKKTKCGSN